MACKHCTPKNNKPRCPRCESRNHYIKESRGKHFCRTCGFLWPVVVDDTIFFDVAENLS